ncbi:MAG: hypothetical protein UT39_C0007G0029 [Candidatus Woesebacteria bacterium GW2011_GWA1_39_21]|uniref:Glycosyltransferase RgtA/B/C/D-like domain-containing protein n=1 Tax=Candidatus Woesebacteria bacterium GW2011_GWA1_39_21 TaxID=1618550 RepID=A0A0G0N5G8_9BACT|nr:MAG: hypothetical protein UT39_C0007G0029 [Candidatus Woesebacteria bacterium GW2011_GWA1_39_21]
MLGKIKKHQLFVFLIFVLAIVLRFWQLGLYPDAIDEDEMAFGYYGWSLSNFGTDEYGHRFPIYFESVGDNKYGLYSYFAAVPIRIFGLNNVSTRSVSAIAGALSVILLYLTVKKLTNNLNLSLISAFVLAVNPIHIHFSRVAYNNNLGALLAMTAIYFFISYLKDGKNTSLLFSFIFSFLSFFTYQTYRIFLPLSLFLLFVVYSKKLKIKKTATLFLLLVFLGVFASFISPKSRTRSQDVDILINRPKLIEQYTEDGLSGVNLVATRLLHNKYVSIGYGFYNRYLSYFDPVFLFSSVSATTERHSIPDTGVFYFFEFIFLIAGFIALKNVYGKYYLLPIVLLVASPVAASMVVEPRSITRTLVLVWGVTMVVSCGVYILLKGRRILYSLFLLIYSVGLFYFLHQYFIHKPLHQPWQSDGGHHEMVNSVDVLKSDYKYVVVSRGHYMPFIYYDHISPPQLQKRATFLTSKPEVGTRIASIDNIIFNMPYECPTAGKQNVLYVCFGYKVPKNSRVIKVISFRDSQPAITLVEFGKGEAQLPERLQYMDSDARFEKGILPDGYPNFWPVNE